MNIQPIVSICIPTFGRVEILRNTLNSIYSQNVDNKLFEICISDNSPTNETEELLMNYFYDKKNIHYSKSSCEGYYNSIEALKLGNGAFLKLHNNYTEYKNDTFQKFINQINELKNEKPVLFFSFGNIKKRYEMNSFSNFDDFLNYISYFSTWSTSFGIWKVDFDNIINKHLYLDKMFPHTSLLFNLYNKNTFIVNNYSYFNNQDVGKKGGYNLPETFGNRYLEMCRKLLNDEKITYITFNKIKKGILRFISQWYVNVKQFPNKYTFSFENWKEIIKENYGLFGILFIVFIFFKEKAKFFIKKIIKVD